MAAFLAISAAVFLGYALWERSNAHHEAEQRSILERQYAECLQRWADERNRADLAEKNLRGFTDRLKEKALTGTPSKPHTKPTWAEIRKASEKAILAEEKLQEQRKANTSFVE